MGEAGQQPQQGTKSWGDCPSVSMSIHTYIIRLSICLSVRTPLWAIQPGLWPSQLAHAWLAGPQAWLDGPEGGQMDVRTSAGRCIAEVD